MDEDFSLDELKLAFTFHIANQIIGADGAVTEEERRFVTRSFPPMLLERSGFVDEAGRFTSRWNAALGEALLHLPERTVAERVAIVETLLDAALADDALLDVEADTVVRAGRLLALDKDQIAELTERWETAEATRKEEP